MDTELAQRLDAQERLLHVIVSALASEGSEGSGFDDLIEVLADLTEAVADMTQAVRSLHSDVFARFPPAGH
jgi:hypothetical protein